MQNNRNRVHVWTFRNINVATWCRRLNCLCAQLCVANAQNRTERIRTLPNFIIAKRTRAHSYDDNSTKITLDSSIN